MGSSRVNSAKDRFTGEMITKGFVVLETGNGYTLFESLNPPVGVFPINGITVRTRVRLTQIPQGNFTRVVATVTMRNQAPGGQAVDYPVVSGRSDMREVQAILLRCAGQEARPTLTWSTRQKPAPLSARSERAGFNAHDDGQSQLLIV